MAGSNMEGAGRSAACLGTVAAYLTQAQTGIAKARSAIEETQRRAAGTGMPGVARQLRQPLDFLGTAQAATSAASGKVDKHKAVAQAVTDQSTTDEVIGSLTPVVEGASKVTGDLAQAKQHLAKAMGSVNHILGDSAGDLWSVINTVSGVHLTKAWAQTTAAKTAAEEAIEKARNLGKQ